MDKEKLTTLLKNVKSGKIDVNEALETLKSFPYEDLGFAKIDTHRDLRKGFPEVIFCQGKKTDQIVKIIEKFSASNRIIMATRAEKDVFDAVEKVRKDAKYFDMARIILIGDKKPAKSDNKILLVSAGTSDMPVAEEAAVTAEVMGNKVERLYDIGVAGIHRLFNNTGKLFEANVLIVAAGMEGALASIVSGMVDKPVVAVPTSVGYGASFNGLSALLTMLNSCAPGIAVVNIDNGFGAGYLASMINQLGVEK
ncbi:nickel pincer cofactor biosynthesis protein LarB [candidate division KSB1 bacterium]